MRAATNDSSSPPEMWAGVECTVNRVGDVYFDQTARSGHDERLSDIDLLAGLGIRGLRFPLLWERFAGDASGTRDWSWGAARLDRLRTLGIRPIVGLLHHGSGPRSTSLVDPGFPEALAAYAQAAAQRFPWIDRYTPVNEPLTTARFSGLYGHWYPHGRDPRIFARAMLNQCKGTVLAMQAIRQVNPNAQLVQTDDLGKTYSTPRLKYQADFENHRRWLTWDLLCGNVDRRHPMREYLEWVGVAPNELDWFTNHRCPPDVIGVNYYVTSERFLDHRLPLYPAAMHGSNGKHAYVDTEAVRLRAEGIAGVGKILREAWDRYCIPLALTEVHLGCTREEQIRWFMEVWDAACAQKAQGADIRAVTAWSALGSFDWDSLVTRSAGHYESGIFDLRAPTPRPTALAGIVRDLAAGNRPTHPVLSSPGWWRRSDRLSHPEESSNLSPSVREERTARPLLIAGSSGTLGQALARLCQQRGLAYRLATRAEMDIADARSVAAALERFDPWAAINAAGYSRVDEAESDEPRCLRENAHGPTVLAEACAARQIGLVTFSTDLVFDGRRRHPYREHHPAEPLGVYGRAKLQAERQVCKRWPEALVIRTSALFGPWDETNFVTAALNCLAAGHVFPAADNLTISPTYLPDLVHAALDLLIDGERGLWHLANVGEVTWADLARQAAERAGLDPGRIVGGPADSLGLIAPRPAYSVLGSARAETLPGLENALDRYFHQRYPNGVAPMPALAS